MTARSVPWTRVTAEFLAIFAGVTLSLAADDWRQGRENRERERTLLLGLHADLLTDSVELSTVLRRSETWDRASAWLQRRMIDPHPLPVDSASGQIRGAILFTLYQPVNAAYSNLKQAGQMPLITDVELRESITEYYEVQQPFMLQFQAIAMDAWSGWSDVFWEYVDVPLPDESSRHWPAQFNFVGSWSDFVTDPRVRPALTELGVLGGNRADRIETTLELNHELRAALREEIEPR